MPEEFVVTPWEVRGAVDYRRLMERFGTQPIDDALLERIRRHTGDLHPFLKRDLYFSHRDLPWILDEYEKGREFVLYTGRGPSGSMHLGHLVPFMFTRWLQEKFGATTYIQITDDEKYLFRAYDALEDATTAGYENLLDIVALGFDPQRTRVFLDTEYIQRLYPWALQVAKRITVNTARSVFGFDGSNNIGQVFYTAIQSVPAFLASVERGENVPCLIPCGIDQDPHFRVTRDVAEQLGFHKPALIHNKLAPGLRGLDSKMSTSEPETAIFTDDPPDRVRAKIADAFTGGRATEEEQRRLGANPYICSVFAYYRYWFAPEDDYLAEVERTCKSGERLCGDCKAELADHVVAFVERHQEAREAARDRLEDFIVRE